MYGRILIKRKYFVIASKAKQSAFYFIKFMIYKYFLCHNSVYKAFADCFVAAFLAMTNFK
ncbi:MAG: hypothetical protein A2W19_03635 [Spirochaetes bacterium RBG_16_49_21]|nr:MAG: hypothetical protein A2W19_03635 [Spirochaetes bacterium RBG_16_49_21]